MEPNPHNINVVRDDAIFDATGGPKGSTDCDSSYAAIKFRKMNQREASGLSLARKKLNSGGNIKETPSLQWSTKCANLSNLMPLQK